MCTGDCLNAICGDGFILIDVEQCDDGKNNGPGQTCLEGCITNICGDGDQSADEGCDDGNIEEGDGCNADCKLEACGNSVKDKLEECDDGANGDNDDECTDLCAFPKCGDTFEQASIGETCDLGPDNSNTGDCTATCKDASCGDGFVWANNEQCDLGDGNNGNDKACKADCSDNICGDGFKGPNDECDDGNKENEDLCTNVCKNAACGDGFKQPGEDCDDMNALDTDACVTGCKTASCGDGFLHAGVELCDDGNLSNNDACPACKPAVCGDGFVQMGTEECDDSNLIPGDGCSALCKLEGVVVKLVAQNKPVVDDSYNGTLATMTCLDLIVPNMGLVTSVEVSVGISHTFVGDLVVKLVSPNAAKTLTMMSRPGYAEAADDGLGGFGNGQDLDKAFPVLFRNLGVKDAETMGNLGSAVCKTDLACDYKPNPGKGPGLTFTDFVGLQTAGTWKVCVGDAGGGDLGVLDSATLFLKF